MKKLIIIYLLGVFTLSGCAKKSNEEKIDVPAPVQEAFSKLFPGATDVVWSKETETEYEAEFKLAGVEKASNFDQFGKWVVTETVVKSTDLPASVQATISKEFAEYSIEVAETVEPAEGPMFYEVELEKGEASIEVKISAEGAVMKQEKVEEEGEEEDDDDEDKK